MLDPIAISFPLGSSRFFISFSPRRPLRSRRFRSYRPATRDRKKGGGSRLLTDIARRCIAAFNRFTLFNRGGRGPSRGGGRHRSFQFPRFSSRSLLSPFKRFSLTARRDLSRQVTRKRGISEREGGGLSEFEPRPG